MAVKSDLNKILQSSSRIELQDLQGKSASWFKQEVASLRRVGIMTPTALMRGDTTQKVKTIVPGNMYMYVYDPKYKEELPYYDNFPLVFPFRKEPNGFYALNLHYLPYHLRANLLTKLLEFKTSKTLTEKTKLKFSWAVISSAAKFALVKPCVKHYLFDHVVSPFKLIPPSDWATTVLLPSESFSKASSQKVWRDSLKIIRT